MVLLCRGPLSRKMHPIIQRLWGAIIEKRQSGWTLCFQHVYSHAGTAGNELADVAADKASGALLARIAATPRDASRIFLAQYKARRRFELMEAAESLQTRHLIRLREGPSQIVKLLGEFPLLPSEQREAALLLTENHAAIGRIAHKMGNSACTDCRLC